jgi:hypothetical protein
VKKLEVMAGWDLYSQERMDLAKQFDAWLSFALLMSCIDIRQAESRVAFIASCIMVFQVCP